MARDLGTFIAIMLSSDADGEVLQAARQARKLLKADDRTGNDVAEALARHGRILEAAKALKIERDQLAIENERLKRLQANGASSTFAQQLWQPAGMPATVENRHARWALDLHTQGRADLTAWEVGFVTNCASRSRLTPKQRDRLQLLVRDVTTRTGEVPPP